MTVALHVNITRSNAYEVALSVYNELKKLGIKIIIVDDVKSYFSDLDAEFSPINEAVQACDILIAIGGDGTIIHSSHYAAEYDKPILGINAGRLGFLAGLEKEELELLKNITEGKYTIESRMMLTVKHYENDRLLGEYLCLNDVVVAHGASMRLCEIDACCNGRKISNFHADGLIIATPTGSTAYSLSAGGPVVDTEIESLILTPVCAHTVLARSMVFKPDSVIELTVKNDEACLPIFSCDGETGIEINNNSKLVITRADRVAKILKIKSDSFSDILTQKLVERYGH